MTRTEIFIDGHWEIGQGAGFYSTCPVDESVVWQGNEASESQVDQAFVAARQAFGGWWDCPADQRIAITRKFAELVAAAADELAMLIAQETGKPLWEAKTEVGAVTGKIELSIDAYHARRDTTTAELAGMNAVTRYKPHGVCAVLGPFNFPAHLPNGHIAPALIAGNTVVFKPSEITPGVGAWMTEKWQQAGLPRGVLNLLQGGRRVGIDISQHPQLDGLFFTGSSGAGKALHRAFRRSSPKNPGTGNGWQQPVDRA